MNINLDKYEEEAVDAGGEAAGRYLETLGKFDVSLLSPSEWRKFVSTIYVAATARIQEIRSLDDDVPF